LHLEEAGTNLFLKAVVCLLYLERLVYMMRW